MEANAAHARLVDGSARSKADDNKTRAELDSSIIRIGKVELKSGMASANLSEARMKSVESAKAAKKAIQQPTEVLSETRLLDSEVSFQELETGKCIKERSGAIRFDTEQSWQARMSEACISLLEDELGLIKQRYRWIATWRLRVAR